MTTPDTSFGTSDLRDIGEIIDRLERSRFSYLDMQIGDLRITLGERLPSPVAHETPLAAHPAPAPALAADTAPHMASAAASPSTTPASSAPASGATHGTPVRAPMVGRFYAKSEPGAEPYAKVGDVITADTTIGLIEVMKVFQAVMAGVAGTVLSVAVQDGDFVEFEQALLYVGEA